MNPDSLLEEFQRDAVPLLKKLSSLVHKQQKPLMKVQMWM